ncbi:hypothetical protein [Thermosulfurimonas sp. F29]|uniref:hypothetical protein n=1 Tax=Thermosulfurimonas sp. F29 TaxID=2867247 RepID=UPI001C8358C3|nr:hypothetical protein [Thermosulfurimonas sp. F29]MBX6424221.1 hypothetical protein [Thermosulfurimonas sp. F29]
MMDGTLRRLIGGIAGSVICAGLITGCASTAKPPGAANIRVPASGTQDEPGRKKMFASRTDADLFWKDEVDTATPSAHANPSTSEERSAGSENEGDTTLTPSSSEITELKRDIRDFFSALRAEVLADEARERHAGYAEHQDQMEPHRFQGDSFSREDELLSSRFFRMGEPAFGHVKVHAGDTLADVLRRAGYRVASEKAAGIVFREDASFSSPEDLVRYVEQTRDVFVFLRGKNAEVLPTAERTYDVTLLLKLSRSPDEAKAFLRELLVNPKAYIILHPETGEAIVCDSPRGHRRIRLFLERLEKRYLRVFRAGIRILDAKGKAIFQAVGEVSPATPFRFASGGVLSVGLPVAGRMPVTLVFPKRDPLAKNRVLRTLAEIPPQTFLFATRGGRKRLRLNGYLLEVKLVPEGV